VYCIIFATIDSSFLREESAFLISPLLRQNPFYMKKKLLKLILSINIFVSTPCWASDGAAVQFRGFQIGQEHIAKDGVLISRPVRVDERLAQIMGQNSIRTVEDYATWLGNNMVYQSETGSADNWLDPAEFLKTKRGDCEDFAILNARALKVLGYKTHIVTLKSSQRAHAICAFQYGGKFYWFDNARLKTSGATTLAALAQEITNQFHYLSSYELDPQSKQTNLIYKRS